MTRRFPRYSDDSDYTTNSPSYYDDLAKKNKLIKLLSKRIWEYDKTLDLTLKEIEEKFTDYINENNELMNKRLENWDKRIEEMPDEMSTLFVEWLNDGTLEEIINHDVLGNKADKTYVDDLNEDVTSQLKQTINNLASYPRLAIENDDTGRFNRLIEGTMEGETAFIPYQDEWYSINDTIVIDKRINFISKGKIGYHGHRNKTAIRLDSITGIYFELYMIADGNNASNDNNVNYGGYHGWDNINYVGVEAINLKWCTLKIYEIRNFTTGFKASADNGSGYWFNKHHILNTLNNLRHIEINSNSSGSWLNGNYFYETSMGYGSSHAPFINDNRMKYGILQTLTNGNEYGGNSNIFYNFKFETNINMPYGFTQIKTVLANGWRFDNYRQELNGNNLHLLEMNLSHVKKDIVTSGAHSNLVTLNPFSVIGSKGRILFTNTEKINSNYPHIASFDGWEGELKTLIELSNLNKNARKVNQNNLILSNNVFTNLNNENVHHENISNYGGVIENDYIRIQENTPLLLYIENVNKGDTFYVEANNPINENMSFGIEIFDINNEKIKGMENNGEKQLGYYGRYNDNYMRINPYSSNNYQTFTVNSDDVKTIRLNIAGVLNNITVKTDSENAIVKKTQNENKKNNFFFNSKPVSTMEGGFEVGDTVYSTEENIGWSLDNNNGLLEWNEFTY